MVQIISDTSTLYSVEEGKKNNLVILPLQITINQKTYKEFEELSSSELLDLIQQGFIPSSSQPAIGEVLKAYEEHMHEPVINLCMTDGLSGTYQNALMAKQQVGHDHLFVINSKTLCGPHRYLVDKALELSKQGKTAQEIIDKLTPSIDSSISFLIPQDFDYLKRGGRVSKASASIGGLLKLTVVMKQSDDGLVLEKHALARTYKKALCSIADTFKERGVDETYILTISHATSQTQFQETVDFFKNEFPAIEICTHALSPAFITQGGPGCLAIQAIKKIEV